MRTELAFQWGLVADEIPIVFEKLAESTKAHFLTLQSHLKGIRLKEFVFKVGTNKFSLLEQGFDASLVEGIDFRIQDIDYKLVLLRQELTHGIKYALGSSISNSPADTSSILTCSQVDSTLCFRGERVILCCFRNASSIPLRGCRIRLVIPPCSLPTLYKFTLKRKSSQLTTASTNRIR
jgi:hypothetical protein